MQNDQHASVINAQDDVETDVTEQPIEPGETASEEIEPNEVAIDSDAANEIDVPIPAEMETNEIEELPPADSAAHLTEAENTHASESATPAAAEPPSEIVVETEKSKKEKTEPPRKALAKELDSLRVEYAKMSAQHAELKDRYLRLAAEMQNFRKRVERDFGNRLENTIASLLAELLPVVDDLERFFDAGSENKDYETLAGGVNLIYQNILKILQNRGVVAMQAAGSEFDPLRHEAIYHMPVDGNAANIVVEENTKGYMLFDKVLRPAKVVVSA